MKKATCLAAIYGYSALSGAFMGIGCTTAFGWSGGLLAAVAMGAWGVLSAKKLDGCK